MYLECVETKSSPEPPPGIGFELSPRGAAAHVKIWRGFRFYTLVCPLFTLSMNARFSTKCCTLSEHETIIPSHTADRWARLRSPLSTKKMMLLETKMVAGTIE